MDVDSSEADSLTIEYPNAGKVIGQGVTFMDDFNDDQFSKERELNVYYPFASRPEWETASFLLNSSLSMNEIDTYLKLDLVSVSSELVAPTYINSSRPRRITCLSILLKG